MIIEVGKSFRMRNREITEIVRMAMGNCFISAHGWAYTNEEDGNLVFGDGEPHAYDLMEEI